MRLAFPLRRPDFEHLIPHAGAMVLLTRVMEAGERSIRCEADSHTDANNPLRNAHGLPITAGIEYAAQAMALHAALNRGEEGVVQGGMIAVLSDVRWHCDRLDTMPVPLCIEAALLAETGQGRQYSFAVSPKGAEPALTGLMIVAFE